MTNVHGISPRTRVHRVRLDVERKSAGGFVGKVFLPESEFKRRTGTWRPHCFSPSLSPPYGEWLEHASSKWKPLDAGMTFAPARPTPGVVP